MKTLKKKKQKLKRKKRAMQKYGPSQDIESTATPAEDKEKGEL